MKALTQATKRLLAPIAFSKADRLLVDVDEDARRFVAEFYQATPDGKKGWPSYHVQRTFLGRIPERKQLDGGCRWLLGATDLTATIIDAVWPKDQIEFTPEARIFFDYLLATMTGSIENAERVARYKESKEVPKHDIELHPEFPLSPYQQVAAVNSCRAEGYNLFMEQGTGKTPIVIARVCNEARQLREGRADMVAYRKSEAMIRARWETAISKMKAEAREEVEAAIHRKKAKLETAAKKRAEKMHVRLEYEGTADLLLAKAREAVRQAEQWLSRRIREIGREMRRLRVAAEARSDQLVAAEEDRMRADCRRELDRIVVKRKPGEERMYRALIVVPNNLRLNWYREFEKFATKTGNVTVIRGGEIERAKLFIDAFTPDDDCLYTAVVVSYESFIRMWNQLRLVEWDLAVLDEGHYIKSQHTKRYKFALKLRQCSRQRMLLTGTPITNTPLDLYTQFEFLGEGMSGFHTWKAFREFYGVYKPTGEGYERLVGCQNMPFMQERLARLSFIIRKEEALPDLPDKVYDVYEVEMTARQREIYERVAAELVAEIESDLARSENRAITVTNILTKLLRLAQITSGFVTYDAQVTDDGELISPKEIERLDPNPKLEALVDLLKEKGPKQKTLVWACWVQDIRSVAARLRVEGIDCVTFYGGTKEADRVEAERRFNYDPKCQVFIGNPTAGGVGLNLLGYPPTNGEAYETNCDHEIYFSQNWSPTARSQSEARAHRRGTRTNVRITDLCVPETIDEEIRARVMKKRLVAYQIADVREILRNVLKGAF